MNLRVQAEIDEPPHPCDRLPPQFAGYPYTLVGVPDKDDIPQFRKFGTQNRRAGPYPDLMAPRHRLGKILKDETDGPVKFVRQCENSHAANRTSGNTKKGM